MKVFISADIEGTNGIASFAEADNNNEREYTYFANRMTEEVGAVCDGINSFDGNADILIKDAHATARNIDHAKLPGNARLLRGWAGKPCSMINGLDGSFDAAVFSGYHSPAYTGGNPLAHTINSTRFSRVLINGRVAGEFHINYFGAMSLGVPVVMVSGDKYLMELVNETDPDIVTVAALEAYGNGTVSSHPSGTLAALTDGAKKAMANAAALKEKISQKLPAAFEIEITFKRHVEAFKAAFFPGMSQIDAATVGYECADFFDFLKAWMFI
ncbi:MAG: M55 family metallopeptidase [Clostridiales bacterium]|jgi:D-amino peptidase|nr:M55 family metallopeptidase [Clostridiales bacterium]